MVIDHLLEDSLNALIKTPIKKSLKAELDFFLLDRIILLKFRARLRIMGRILGDIERGGKKKEKKRDTTEIYLKYEIIYIYLNRRTK